MFCVCLDWIVFGFLFFLSCFVLLWLTLIMVWVVFGFLFFLSLLLWFDLFRVYFCLVEIFSIIFSSRLALFCFDLFYVCLVWIFSVIFSSCLTFKIMFYVLVISSDSVNYFQIGTLNRFCSSGLIIKMTSFNFSEFRIIEYSYSNFSSLT